MEKTNSCFGIKPVNHDNNAGKITHVIRIIADDYPAYPETQ
ncbi:hypothetical protein [Yersinia rohdei]|nr:hypothetical protein [Yersinia rohdei]EEQ02276.1 hypothetical protein yrohd0001_35490 [Yersinia rohdei ATCC 43380]MDN0093822.1 hypothetical protein [Yersinia rohdei]